MERRVLAYDTLRQQGWRTAREVMRDLGLTLRAIYESTADLSGLKVSGRWLFPPAAPRRMLYLVRDL